MTLEHNDDQELLGAAMSGDQEAFLAIFMSFRPELCVHVYSITSSHDDVEDVIQDIYISVFQAIQGRNPINFKIRAYLYTAAKRRAIKIQSSKDIEVPYDASSDAFEVVALEADEPRFDSERREWRHEEIREALREGNEEMIDKWRGELRKIFPETEEPSE